MGYKIYLDVPFDEKEEAKNIGASWDKYEKKWYFFINEEGEKKEQALKYLRYAKWHSNKIIRAPKINLENLNNVSIKIGENIGKSLLTALQDASERIYISSPYLGEATAAYLKELKYRKNKVDFKVLFSVNNFNNKEILENFVESNLKENLGAKYENQKLIENLEKNIKKEKIYSWIYSFVILLGISYLSFVYWDTYIVKYPFILAFFALIFLFGNFYFFNKIKTFNKKKLEYEENDFHYLDFSSTMSHRVLLENEEENFPHLKLYIIDNVAFLGSGNFSNKSLFFNIESLIEIRDIETVEKLVAYFNELYEYSYKTEKDTVETIGNEIYDKWEVMRKNQINEFY